MERVTDVKRAREVLSEAVDQSTDLVFFGGAGVSTASGIPDFRSEDGLYRQQFAYPPETMLSHSFYETHPAEFFDFYRKKMVAPDARPNRAHYKLAELEESGPLTAVLTQNIDGLHQMAGPKNVLELHGSVHRNVCQRCGHVYPAEWVLATKGIPVCEECGGPVKPDVVLYEEPLDQTVLNAAADAVAAADTLIVGGTSLVVWPVAGLVDLFSGRRLIIVNRGVTAMDGRADAVLDVDIAQAFDF